VVELGVGDIGENKKKNVLDSYKKNEGTCRKDDPRTFTVANMLLQSCGKLRPKTDGTVACMSALKHDNGPILGKEEEKKKKLHFFGGLFMRQTTLEHCI
jgi:hypothetical protein